MLTGEHVEQFMKEGSETVVRGKGIIRWVTREAWVGPFWVREEVYCETEGKENIHVAVSLPDLVSLGVVSLLFEFQGDLNNEKESFEKVARFLMSLDYQPLLSLGERIRTLQMLDSPKRSAYERLEDDLC